MSIILILLSVRLFCSLLVSVRAYRQTGQLWMLFMPHWIDVSRGVCAARRRHGKIAFSLLFAGVAAFLLYDT